MLMVDLHQHANGSSALALPQQANMCPGATFHYEISVPFLKMSILYMLMIAQFWIFNENPKFEMMVSCISRHRRLVIHGFFSRRHFHREICRSKVPSMKIFKRFFCMAKFAPQKNLPSFSTHHLGPSDRQILYPQT